MAAFARGCLAEARAIVSNRAQRRAMTMGVSRFNPRASGRRGVTRLAAALVAGLMLACGEAPTQPKPLTDCTMLGVTVPHTLEVGQTVRLTAFLEHCRPMYLPLDSDRITWQSLDSAVASVSADSLTAFAEGPAVIQATFGNMTQQSLVIVGANLPKPGLAVPARFRLYGSPAMSVYQRGSFGAFAVMTDGTVTRVSAVSAWRSSDPSVAGLSATSGDVADRAVDAFSAGAATITANYQGMSTALSIQVTQN
jgi:hypothetical protein